MVKRYLFSISMAVVLVATIMIGCSDKGKSSRAMPEKAVEEKAAAVATIGGQAIRRADFEYYLSSGQSGGRAGDEKMVKKQLDHMILQEVMYQEALRLKMDQDPELLNNIKQMLTQKLLDKEINQKVWHRKIEEKELEAYYEAHQDEFNRPEQIRVADIFIKVPPDASPEQRAKLREKGETVLAEALKVKQNRSGFGRLVRKYSDSSEKYSKGDTGFFDADGKPAGIDLKLVKAAFQLERNGSLSEKLIETDAGYHVIMRTGKRSAFHRPLAQVRRNLEQRIRKEELKTKREGYIEGLKASADIDIDDGVVSDIVQKLNDEKKNKQTARGKRKAGSSSGGSATGMGNSSAPPALPGKK